uniref:DnaJ homolog subfamily C member 10 n=1 Tax=Scleropages formosus TaxID=113540 RepID=A0A8C9TT65_SCLFO
YLRWINLEPCRVFKRPCGNTLLALIIIIASLVAISSTDEDYYGLLGVTKEASSREIRRAFKKHALATHPDTNPKSEGVHTRFLRVRRAYEVLTDEDLRRKYDRYGEKGLQDSQEIDGYRSYDFYRYDFGVYDDDLEIITLDREDFDMAVNSGELWFVNFYFPNCADCHDLEPTWREFAKEMEGLLRVAAVDCGYSGDVCKRKGITSYPTFLLIKAGMVGKYLGDRSKESLTNFTMQFVKNKVTELWQGNVFGEIERAFVSGIGWIITFCAETGDCLSSEARQKLAGMLDGLANVGWMDCSRQPDLCASFDVTSSTTAYFSPSIQTEKQSTLVRACGSTLKGFLWSPASCAASDESDTSLFPLDCTGGDMLYEVASFAKDSVRAHVTTLRPGHFPSDRKEPWLVEFFIPRCPPCHTLLPELRKASVQLFGQVKFGTLDCTVLKELCRKHNIRSYPTMVLFNQSSIHGYEGRHSAEGIVDFVEHLVNPVVVTLTPDTFQKLVKRRESTEAWLVDFYVPWCGPCQALLPEWRKVARMFSGIVRVGTVDCGKYQSFCEQEDVQAYPEIRLFPQSGSHPDRYQSYGGWSRDAASLRTWALESLPRASEDLSPEDLRKHVYSGKEHWVLDFSAPWCEPCQDFAPEFELLAHMMKGSVRAGKVDCHTHSQACEKAGIKSYPTVRFYPYLGSSKVSGASLSTHVDPACVLSVRQSCPNPGTRVTCRSRTRRESP